MKLNRETLERVLGSKFKTLKTGIVAGALAVTLIMGVGCQNDKEQEVAPTEGATIEDLQEQIASLQSAIESLTGQVAEGGRPQVGMNDSYSHADWENFVDNAKSVVEGSINNMSDRDFRMALIALNIEYLLDNAEGVIASEFEQGQNVQMSVLNPLNTLVSHIRNVNINATEEGFIPMEDFFLCGRDQAVIAVLDNYVREAIILSQNPTEENTRKYNELFTTISKFFRGEGTIRVGSNDVSHNDFNNGTKLGATFASQTVHAETVSKRGTNIVAEASRRELDETLTAANVYGRLQILLERAATMGTMVSTEISVEAQNRVIASFHEQLNIVTRDFEAAGVTREEAHDLIVVANIAFFQGDKNNQEVFKWIFEDGINLDSLLENAMSAIEKVMTYNERHTNNPILMADVVMVDEHNEERAINDFIIIEGIQNALRIIATGTPEEQKEAVLNLKAWVQFSELGVVVAEYYDESGNIVGITLDRNSASLGANKVTQKMIYISVANHRTVYVPYADTIIPLTDDSVVDYSTALRMQLGELCDATKVPVLEDEKHLVKN